MTGPEHYRAAEQAISAPTASAQTSKAQVRALLALVGVVAETRDAIRELVEELRIPVDAVVADVDDPIGLVPTDPDLPGGPPASPPRFLAHRIVSVPEEVE